MYIRNLLIFLILLFNLSCSINRFDEKWTKIKTPDIFTVSFYTTKGNFDVEIKREYSPKAVDRFYQLVYHKFYDNTVFYRVIPNSIAQFSLLDTVSMSIMENFKIPDEKVILGNHEGTISFAREGPETRGNGLFFNLKNNIRYDTITYEGVIGFPCFGKVKKGIEVLKSINSEYDETPMNDLDLLIKDKKKFFQTYPKIDKIKRVVIKK